MKKSFPPLAARIRQEMEDLDYTVRRAVSGMEKVRTYSDDMYLDVVALNLHGFYSGIEKLFEKIAIQMDQHLPQGSNWHQALLQQMSKEALGVRPAVISESIREKLDEYRGFRHVVRHVYTYRFDPEKIGMLADNSSDLFDHLKKELLAFADFLEDVAIRGPE